MGSIKHVNLLETIVPVEELAESKKSKAYKYLPTILEVQHIADEKVKIL